MSFPKRCCVIDRAIVSSSDCIPNQGGAYDLRLACARYVNWVKVDCDGNTVEQGDVDGEVYELNAGTFTLGFNSGGALFGATPNTPATALGAGDGDPVVNNGAVPPAAGAGSYIIDLQVDTTVTDASPRFYAVETADKTLEYLAELTFDVDTRTRTITNTINFDVDIKNREFYCTMQKYLGQELVAIFREKGSDRWYLIDGLTATSITLGTGTDTFTPTSFVLTNTDSDGIFVEIDIAGDGDLTATTTRLDEISTLA